MKILQVCPKFHPSVASGSTRVAYCISKELARRGHSVTVYTSNMKDKYTKTNSGLEEMDCVKVYRFQSLGTTATREMKIFVTPRIISSLKNELCSFDVVHIHEYRSFQSIVAHHYAKKYGVPYVLQAHGSLPRAWAWRRLKWVFDVFFGYWLLRDAAKVIALSQVEAEQYRSMGVPEEKIAVIPNGIDLSEYAVLPPRGSFKRKFDIPDRKKIVLYLGRIHKTKGIDLLVKAYAYLIKEMKCTDALLVIAGPDDGYLTEVKRLLTSLKIVESLFTEMLSEKEKISAYVDSRIVVNVEPRNVFGLVPLEAAACSTPVVVSKGNAIRETIHEGKFGFSVKYGEVIGLAKIMSILLNDDCLAKEMGQKGRKYIFENYNWTNSITKLEKVYQEIHSRSRAKM